MAKMKVLQRMM